MKTNNDIKQLVSAIEIESIEFCGMSLTHIIWRGLIHLSPYNYIHMYIMLQLKKITIKYVLVDNCT